MTTTNLPAITPSITDAGIVEAIKQKRTEAAPILYDRYAAAVYGMLRQVSTHAEDVLQDVFAYAWKDINNYPSGRRSLLSWLITIALDLAQEKDKNAYLKALSYFSRAFYPNAYELLKNNKAVHELLQETMIEVWEALALDNSSNTSSILFNGLKDKAIRWLADRKREKIMNTLEVPVTHIAGAPVEIARKSLQTVVKRLSPDVLDVITAVFIEAQPPDKVASDRNIKLSDVFQHIITICKLLSKFLDTEKP